MAEASTGMAGALGAAGLGVVIAMPVGDVRDLRALDGAGAPAVLAVAERLEGFSGLIRPRHLHRAMGRVGGAGPPEGCARAKSGARVRARAERVRTPGTRCALASAAGTGRAAFPVQHARQRAGARRYRIAAGVGGAAQPRRVSARRGAAPQRTGDDARPGARARQGVSRTDAHAHARSAQVCVHVDDSALGAALSADDAADAGRERSAPRHRSERGGRPHRHPRRAARRSLHRARRRHRRRPRASEQRARHRAFDIARAPATDVRRRCRTSRARERPHGVVRRDRDPVAGNGRHDAHATDRTDRRRRAVAARSARAPARRRLARARHRRRRRATAAKRSSQFEARRPDVCFLDVHMPGVSGVEAAHHDRPARASRVRHRVRSATPCRRSPKACSIIWSSRSRRRGSPKPSRG